MLRAAAWTGGLFGVGTAICGLFHQGWIQPIVLVALGAALLAVSSRTGRAGRPRRIRSLAAKEAAA
jgi:hypothetical protein